MSELIEFLMSKEVFIVTVVALSIFLLGTIYFVIEKIILDKKLSKGKEESEESIVLEEQTPMIEQMMTNENSVAKEEKTVEKVPQAVVKPAIEDIYKEVKEEVQKQDELLYTEITPNKEEAMKELEKVTEELIKKEETNNVEPTKFEEEQEENAIISIDELLEKSGVLYEKNEITQYLDEGNEPISLADLEQRMNQMKAEPTKVEQKEIPPVIPIEELKVENKVVEDSSTINTNKLYQESTVFKSSPIISPIFGIEKKEPDVTSMELENTANYPKFDEEMKKTNEFLTTLKELQKNLE